MFILCLHLFTCNKQVSGNDCAVPKNQYFLLITVFVSWDQFVIISRWNSIKPKFIYLIWPNSHDNWWQSKKHCTNAILHILGLSIWSGKYIFLHINSSSFSRRTKSKWVGSLHITKYQNKLLKFCWHYWTSQRRIYTYFETKLQQTHSYQRYVELCGFLYALNQLTIW